MPLYLYTTVGCHLCEQAQQVITPLLAGYGLVLEAVEISASDDLLAAYSIRIPVLGLGQGRAELDWPFTASQVLAYLEENCSGGKKEGVR